MHIFEDALRHTLGIEGGFTDDPADSGGATNWGITEGEARAFGYEGDMKSLPISTAKAIYRTNYWDKLSLDDVADLSADIALELFDTGVNCGTGFAGKSLQQALNVFNHQGKDYPDLKVDGLIGNGTMAALLSYLAHRGVEGEVVLMRALNAIQGARYIDIAERRPKDERFIYGWFLNRVG